MATFLDLAARGWLRVAVDTARSSSTRQAAGTDELRDVVGLPDKGPPSSRDEQPDSRDYDPDLQTASDVHRDQAGRRCGGRGLQQIPRAVVPIDAGCDSAAHRCGSRRGVRCCLALLRRTDAGPSGRHAARIVRRRRCGRLGQDHAPRSRRRRPPGTADEVAGVCKVLGTDPAASRQVFTQKSGLAARGDSRHDAALRRSPWDSRMSSGLRLPRTGPRGAGADSNSTCVSALLLKRRSDLRREPERCNAHVARQRRAVVGRVGTRRARYSAEQQRRWRRGGCTIIGLLAPDPRPSGMMRPASCLPRG